MKDNSFKHKEKLTTNTEFRNALYKGKSLKAFPLVIKFLRNDLTFSRLGISVSKISGNAVKRNYFKRSLREWFRNNKNLFREPVDIVILLRNKFPYKDAKNFSSLINKKLTQEKIL